MSAEATRAGRFVLGFLVAWIALAGFGSLAAAQTPSTGTVEIVHAGTLLAIPGQPPRARQSLVIRGGRIAEIRDGFVRPEQLGLPEGTRVIDLSSSWVLPGLIDAHTHITGEISQNLTLVRVTRTSADLAFQAYANAMKTLRAGFTTIRNVGVGGESVVALRNAINGGLVIGPRIQDSVEMISVTGGHGDLPGYRDDVRAVLLHDGICNGADDCRRAVRDMVRRGADVIKFAASGGTLTGTSTAHGSQMTAEEMQAIVDSAHALGRRVAAHAHTPEAINMALEAGVDSIEHGTLLDEHSIALFRRSNAYLVPTLEAAFVVTQMAQRGSDMSDAVRARALGQADSRLRAIRRAHQAGIKMAFGTDAAVVPHGQNAREFARLVEAGFTPSETIQMATVNAADLLGLSNETGSLEAGKAADLIAVSRNPLDDITALTDVGFVMIGGFVAKDCLSTSVPAASSRDGACDR